MFHPDPKQFVEHSAKFGPIGQAMVELSRLEFEHDKFVLAIHKKSPKLANMLSRKFPRHFKEKTDFLIGAVLHIRKLRTVPIFKNGEMNLHWLQFQLDELYETRSTLAHGSISYTKNYENAVVWRFERVVSGEEKHQWRRTSTKVGSSFLAGVCTTARALRRYIQNLISAVEGRFVWEDIYKKELEMRRNRSFVKELFDVGILKENHPLFNLLEANNEQ